MSEKNFFDKDILESIKTDEYPVLEDYKDLSYFLKTEVVWGCFVLVAVS